MNKIIQLTVATISLIVACATFAGAKGTANGKGFDFAKTKAFMAEMETRPDFPVSVVLANDYVYSFLALGEQIAPARKIAIVSCLKGVQQKNGGFTGDKVDKNASLLYTDLAIETLGYLKETGAINSAGVRSFVTSLRNSDGGYGYSQVSRESNLASTFYAVRILKTLGHLDQIDRAVTARFIKKFERKKGGFGYVNGAGVADPKSTYMATYVLNALGLLDRPTRNGALKFLATTPYLNAKSTERPELDAQLYTLLTLKELKANTGMGGTLASALLHKLYIPINGGFGPLTGYGSTPDSTTTALRIMTATGSLRIPGS